MFPEKSPWSRCWAFLIGTRPDDPMIDFVAFSTLCITMKEKLPDKSLYLYKNLAYTYEYFNSIDDYKKPVNDMKKEDSFSE